MYHQHSVNAPGQSHLLGQLNFNCLFFDMSDSSMHRFYKNVHLNERRQVNANAINRQDAVEICAKNRMNVVDSACLSLLNCWFEVDIITINRIHYTTIPMHQHRKCCSPTHNVNGLPWPIQQQFGSHFGFHCSFLIDFVYLSFIIAKVKNSVLHFQ